MEKLSGVLEKNRRFITLLHRQTNGIVTVKHAAQLLGLERKETAKLLSALSNQGWARRLRRGLYLLIPLEAASPKDWQADPWILADHLFKPAYIAGWSACEHWGFTEQVFLDIAVFTSARIRERRITIDQLNYVLKKIPENQFFGTRNVWRDNSRINVSDPSRTLVDILDDPKWGGGMRHVVQILDNYLDSEYYDGDLLTDYITRTGNSSPAKRLGFILEMRHREKKDLIEKLIPVINSGYVLLDPTISSTGPYISKWNVRANLDISS
jgi:predicted transcriptional regulator of viral defense system